MVTDMAAVTAQVMGAVHSIALASSFNSDSQPYRFLLDTMALGGLQRDLVIITVFQMPDGYATIRRAARSQESTTISTAANLVNQMFVQRAAWSAFCRHLLLLEEANELRASYSTDENAALEVAASAPFRFVADMLNQGMLMKLTPDSIVVPCVAVAAARLELWSRDGDSRSALYSHFNQCCHTKSIVATLCDWGYAISRNLLLWCGHNDLALSPVAVFFSLTSLPPISKPNYFLLRTDFGLNNDSLLTFRLIDSYADLHLGLTLILKTVLNLILEELSAAATINLSPELEEKLKTCAVEHIVGVLVAATYCDLRLNSTSDSLRKIPSLSAAILKRVITHANEAFGIWITLFNIANDVCYADIRLVEVFEEIFDQMLLGDCAKGNEELVKSGLLLFVSTFSTATANRPGLSKYSTISADHCSTVRISSVDFKFLYNHQVPKKSSADNEGRNSSLPSVSAASSRLKGYSKFK